MSRSILIVDDEASVTLPLEGFFEQRGYQVFRAFYGNQAIDQLQRSRPDLVILDLQMPGVDGVAVLERIHQDYPDTKVLVITAYAERYQKDLDRFQVAAVRAKPVSLGELTRVVEAILEGKSTPAPARPSPASRTDIRILFVEGDKQVYEKILQPYFREAGLKLPYCLAHACNPEEAFQLLAEFQPQMVLLNTTRLPVGVESGRLAADLEKASSGPIEVILYSVPGSAKATRSETQEQLDHLNEAVIRLLRRLQPASFPHGGTHASQ